ncbi:MAG: isoleucine--tRNA ligase [Bacilli bacterium]|nr:isoleucine--tRNA ligase [Bacilli bacterium]
MEEDMFKELDKRAVKEVERSILEYWKKNNIFEKSIEQRKKDFVFYDGPIYANAKPGIHHVLAKGIKDTFTKYKTMQGYRVLRKIGLDTHGLPIEVNVEKKLGFNGKQDIEKFGVENFCKECNKNTALNIDEVNKLTDMMGQFIDCDNPYVTCSNEFIESEWWIIKEMFKKDLIYHGNKILWYCPRCGTELSQNEVAQGYQEDPVNSIILPFKKSDEDAYFLVWTTTPWTLMANVALCVNPKYTYVKVESMGYKFIICESLVEKVLGDDIKVLESYKGRELVGIKYDQFLPFVNVEGKAFEVLADEYVTDSDGTGIVHIAPAYGADDNRVANDNGISFVNPVGPDGCYTEGPWKGRLVTDPELEIEIIKYLKENDKLFKKIKLTHDYPHCWRCKSALISYPKPAWYVATTKYKDKIIAANSKINWYPEYVGEKRFANWLDNMIDWGISRSRYWGCPLPIWKNDETGELYCIGSRKELQDLAIEDIDVNNLELHRPYIDNIHIKSPITGDTLTRVEDVLDVWFDSGSMPYAQFHYPFENKELFESQFPADFIAEGIDQTRGWFYVLLVISTIISGESCFKNVVVNDMVLDGNGKKMSKSTGNIIDPIEVIEKYGADNIRWYMFYVSPVWTPLKFDIEGLKEVYSKFFNPLRNTYNFFSLYANTDNIDIKDCNVSIKDYEEIDRWLLSRYNSLLKNVTKAYDAYDLNIVVKSITDFVSDDLSNWYIRRNRNRFWGSTLDNSKKSVYKTTYEVLVGLSKMIAPVIPYLSEEMYQNLTGNESVHLADFPKYDEKLIDLSLEEKMDLVRSLISTGRYVREENKIKVRQPLPEALIDGKNKKILASLTNLIMEELNVKKLTFADDLNAFMTLSVKPNFREVGKVFGKNMGEYQNKLSELSFEDIVRLQNNQNIRMTIGDEEYDITPEMVEIRYTAKEGFNVGMENGNFIILDTRISEELKMEGNAREFVSKVQQLRKESGFDIADRIITIFNCDEEFANSILENIDYIKNETLSVELKQDDSLDKDLTLNDYNVGIKLQKK